MQNHPKLPKYWTISQEMREKIESGELAPGARLPSVAQMQAQHGVSLSTVNQARALLEKDGLIVREQGRGTFVAERARTSAAKKLGLVLHVEISAHPYLAELLAGVRAEATRQKWDVRWLSDDDTGDSAKADAVLMYCHPSEALSLNLPSHTPYVLMIEHSPDFTCVVADDFTGAKMATRHLLELGHRRIACLLGAEYDTTSQQRLAGYQSALGESGITVENGLQFLRRKTREQSYRSAGEAEMKDWLQNDWANLRCTAILAHNDETAIGVIQALREHGLRVPHDVSVVGFDGTELSELSTPSLTTVQVPLREIAATAVRTLAAQMKKGGATKTRKITLPVQMKWGDSTAPLEAMNDVAKNCPAL